MPRTKRPVRKPEKLVEDNVNLKNLDKIVMEMKKKIDDRAQLELRNVDVALKILIGTISKTFLQRTIGELKNELDLKELPTARSTRNSSRAVSHDDGYLTENSSQSLGDRNKRKNGIPISTTRTRRSRSADVSSSSRKMAPPTATKQSRRQSRSVYRTPAYNKNAITNYPAITPKVAPHTPLTVLRQPRQGEMVVSMSGSPVMVTSYNNMAQDELANCNIMLQDGTMLSLQPKQLRQSQAYIPFSLMDSNVLLQLRTLKENLDKVVKLGEKAIK